jgi:isochorismate synthase
VDDAVAAIRAGVLEKVVLAREVRLGGDAPFDVADALRRLRAAYRDCYVFGLWRGGRAFVGASPERLVRLDGRVVRASSLAGSVRRGETPAEDSRLVDDLRESDKDRVEHAVVRDALVSALGDLCDGVTADDEPSVLTLRQIHHLHTEVRARLRAGRSILDLVRRLHPTPAVGGQPRAAALGFLRAHEDLDRGWYAAPVGWIGRDAGEFAVALRSALIIDAEATLYAGCGVVADSDAEREYAESALKLRPMEQALSGGGPT